MPAVVPTLRGAPADAMGEVPATLLAMIDVIDRGGWADIEEVIIDMGYSLRAVEDVHFPMAERGKWLTFDYKASMVGNRGTHKGAILIDGMAACPYTPEELWVQQRPASGAPREVWLESRKKRAALEPYVFRTHGKPTPDMHHRVMCPAAAGKAMCPLVAGSMSLPAKVGRPQIFDPASTSGNPEKSYACCGKVITIGAEVARNVRQRYMRASIEWERSFNRRPEIERSFSVIFGQYRLDEMKFYCLAKRMFLVALGTAAVNIERVRDWELLTGQETGLLAPASTWDPRQVREAA
ncbi:MAG: hypothetical protein ACYCU7_07070 [Acidimicrobiales bacterium]